MKRTLGIIVGTALCILLFAGCTSIGQPESQNTPENGTAKPAETQKPNGNELRSCSVSTGGGMLGGYSQSYLKREKTGGATLEVREKETHADREQRTVYQVDESALDHLAGLVERYDLKKASEQPYSDMIAYDADTTTISFSYKGDAFSISENQVMTKTMTEGFNEVIRYMRSLETGEGEHSQEPQPAYLYLRSGYTLRFLVEDAFDGKLDDILSVEREVSAFGGDGIVLCTGEQPDLSDASPDTVGAAGTIVYDGETDAIIILYNDHDFGHDVWLLAQLDGYVSSACPLIAEMEGTYRLFLNGTP